MGKRGRIGRVASRDGGVEAVSIVIVIVAGTGGRGGIKFVRDARLGKVSMMP